MRIQHNIMAMSAYRNYNTNTSALSKNLEKLSSGYKINRAGDDAAGLAISEKMRAQITGLNAASKNVKDGISLVKTAEGAMQEIQDMLNRMEYLATQSANGTYDNDVDRANLQKEMDQLKTEINRIADSANFNGIKLLNGDMDQGGRSEQASIILPDQSAGQFGEIGTKTVVKKEGAPAQETAFGVQFDNLTINAEAGDKLTVQIGATEYELTLNAGKNTAADLAGLLKDAVDAQAEVEDAAGGKADFDAKVEGTTVVFTQKAKPTSAADTVDAHMAVQMTFTKADGTETVLGNGAPAATEKLASTPAPQIATYGDEQDTGTAGVYSYKITTAFGAGDKLTIGGKEITFGTDDDADVDTSSATTAAGQAGVIKSLFADDTTWTVTQDTSDVSKLIFTQKTPSESNALTATVAGPAAGSATGVLTAGATTNYSAGTKGTFELTVGTNFKAGEKLTVDGTTIEFVDSDADGKVTLGSDAAGTMKNIAAFLETNGTTNYTVAADNATTPTKLVFTEKVAGSQAALGTTAPTATVVKVDGDSSATGEVTTGGGNESKGTAGVAASAASAKASIGTNPGSGETLKVTVSGAEFSLAADKSDTVANIVAGLNANDTFTATYKAEVDSGALKITYADDAADKTAAITVSGTYSAPAQSATGAGTLATVEEPVEPDSGNKPVTGTGSVQFGSSEGQIDTSNNTNLESALNKLDGNSNAATAISADEVTALKAAFPTAGAGTTISATVTVDGAAQSLNIDLGAAIDSLGTTSTVGDLVTALKTAGENAISEWEKAPANADKDYTFELKWIATDAAGTNKLYDADNVSGNALAQGVNGLYRKEF